MTRGFWHDIRTRRPRSTEDATMMIGVVGGTGPAGRGLALRLADAGYDVLLGSREEARGRQVVDELVDDWPEPAGRLDGTDNETAACADLVVMAAPWEGVLSLAQQLDDRLEGKTVVSMANALIRVGRSFMPLTLPRGSVAAELQARLPKSSVVGAFHHLPAREIADLNHQLDCDVLIYGDAGEARDDVATLVERIKGLRSIQVGTLASAGTVEALTAVLIQVNVTYKTHSMLRLVGDFR
jgi:NADPH-dependent F420 reductase